METKTAEPNQSHKIEGNAEFFLDSKEEPLDWVQLCNKQTRAYS